MRRSGCDPESLLRLAEGAGVEARLERPGLVLGGDSWWGPGGDAWPLGSLLDHRDVAVAYPRSVGDVERLVEAAYREGRCLAVRGGGSGVLGAIREHCCLVLDLSGLDWVRVDEDRMVVVAGAGARLWSVEEEASRHGLTTGLEPQSIRVASVGGLVATLGSGSLTPGVGNIEDSIVGVRAVFPGLGVVALGSPRAPRGFGPLAGPQILLGQEGGLGIIVEVVLRLRRAPMYRAGATFYFDDFRAGLEAARRLVQWNPPGLLRVLDEDEAGVLYGEYRSALLVEYYDDEDPALPERLLEKARRVVESVGGTTGRDILGEWRKTRYDYMGWVRKLYEAGLWFDTIDTQAPWPLLADLNNRIKRELAGVDGVYAVFSHASHFYPNGGSLYTTIVYKRDPVVGGQAWLRILRAVLETGASVTHHHGVGLQKLYWWLRENPGQARLYCKLLESLGEGVLWHPIARVCRCLDRKNKQG